jgi:hypothetical protein
MIKGQNPNSPAKGRQTDENNKSDKPLCPRTSQDLDKRLMAITTGSSKTNPTMVFTHPLTKAVLDYSSAYYTFLLQFSVF